MQKCNRSCTLASRNESPGSGQGLQRAASLCQALHLGNLPSQHCTVSLQLSGTDLCLHHRSKTRAQPWEKPKVPWRCSPGGSALHWAESSNNSSKGDLCQLVPWPSWPSAASAQSWLKSPSKAAAAAAKGWSLAPYSNQHRPCAKAAERNVV